MPSDGWLRDGGYLYGKTSARCADVTEGRWSFGNLDAHHAILQEPVKDIFNYSKKMHIRACDFIADGFQEMHAEDPYEAMAEKMVYCIYNGSVKQRIEKAERLARITESDGAVLFAHWGCKGTIGASSLIKQSLEKTGLPTMILDGDGCNPANTSDGQVSTRLQAFVEMLEKGKEEKHA